jgi:hypothetical protein
MSINPISPKPTPRIESAPPVERKPTPALEPMRKPGGDVPAPDGAQSPAMTGPSRLQRIMNSTPAGETTERHVVHALLSDQFRSLSRQIAPQQLNRIVDDVMKDPIMQSWLTRLTRASR